MVYTANWEIIWYLPPIKGTRKLHWSTRKVQHCFCPFYVVLVEVSLFPNRIHVIGIFPYMYHKNQPNVGKYAIHGCYGFYLEKIPPFNVRVLNTRIPTTERVRHLYKLQLVWVISIVHVYWLRPGSIDGVVLSHAPPKKDELPWLFDGRCAV